VVTARAVAWGEILWDLFPDGRRLGGAPANVAYHLAALGGVTALVSRVGDDDDGRAATAALAAAGVDVSAVQIDAARPTGAVDVSIAGGEATYRLRKGCAWEHIEWGAEARAAIAGAGAICYGSLSQRRPEARAALEAALAARPPGCVAVCDLNLRRREQDADLIRWAVSAADLLKINEREEVELARLLGQGDVVTHLLERGARQVALTRGAAGCSILTASDRIDVPGVAAARGGDNVGCGDAFTAVWVHHTLRGSPAAEAATAACGYAAFVASQRGATPSIPPEVSARARAARG
jgi:fructokinase